MKYKGSCHCGKIAFEAEGQLEQVLECNCTLCRKRGALFWFVSNAQLTLTTPKSDMATYTFNTGKLFHRFCPQCGCAPFSEGADNQGNPMAGINVRCLEDVDLDQLKVVPYDGASR